MACLGINEHLLPGILIVYVARRPVVDNSPLAYKAPSGAHRSYSVREEAPTQSWLGISLAGYWLRVTKVPSVFGSSSYSPDPMDLDQQCQPCIVLKDLEASFATFLQRGKTPLALGFLWLWECLLLPTQGILIQTM